MLQALHGLKDIKNREGLPLLIIVLVLSGFVCYCCFSSQGPRTEMLASSLWVRVLLATTPPGDTLNFSADGPFKIFYGSDPTPYSARQELYSGYRLKKGKVKSDPKNNLILNGNHLNHNEIIVVPKEEGALRLESTRYHGLFHIQSNKKGEIQLINTLDMEHYLAGVLFKEMPTSFPEEALKAQVVAARTYALYRLVEGTTLMTDDARSQVYGGLSAQTVKSTELVNATRGEILVYDGEILPAYYSSTCGGITAKASEIFKGPAPMPVNLNRPCGYCTSSKFYRWRANYSLDEIRKKFGLSKSIKDYEIGITRFDATRRATEISFLDGRGGIIRRYPAESFRRLINQDRLLKDQLLSTRIDRILKKKDTIHFEGRGWGHGVGLCQYGARGLAQRGKTYQEILEYYYPDAEIASDLGGL